MAFFSWSRWLRSLLRPQTKPIYKKNSRLSVEPLESRLAPAQFIWTGAAGDGNWGTAANWQNLVAPSNNGVPNDLIFQGSAGSLNLNNNIGTTTAPLKINSISFAASGYTLGGNAIILGATTGTLTGQTGQINVGPGESETLNFAGMALGGGGTSQQLFNLGTASTLTVSSPLKGTAGAGWQQQGTGTMILTADNSAFTGAFTLGGGVTQIQSPTALGTSASSSNFTTVLAGAQLQIDNVNDVAGFTISENIRLNGTGLANTGTTAGAMLNVKGTTTTTKGVTLINNTWSGAIELDSDATFGVAASQDLTIAGSITDLGAGHSVTKEGAGLLDLIGVNTYRGTTTINNGILTIQNGRALGTGPGGFADDSSADAVIVNTNSGDGETGTLQLFRPLNATGFTVQNKLLILNGGGFNNDGALDNFSGFNTWTGNIILGSGQPNGQLIHIRADGTDPHYSLTVTGVISDPNFTPGNAGPPPTPPVFHNWNKDGAGVLILTNANTYGGTTEITAGTLQIDDSQALGPKSKTNAVTVDNGATLQLAVDNVADSLTGTRNTLNVFTPVNIIGNGDGNIGALASQSGINIYYGTITFAGSAAIGVTADPNPTNTAAYLTDDFSLTVEPPPGATTSNLIGGNFTMTKTGGGQLILPTANDLFQGNTTISQGWITIENNDSLGKLLTNAGQNGQPLVTVKPNAALMLDAPAGTSLNLHQNFSISGTGIKHPFSEINQQGAIEDIAGINSIEGNIFFSGPTNVGVETVFGASQLSLLGEQSQQATAAAIPVSANASGSSAENDNIIATGASSGTITISYNMYYIPDTIDVYYGVKGAGGIDIKSTGPISGSGTLVVPYAPIGAFSTTTVEIVLDQGGGPSGTAWSYTALVQPAAGTNPNITNKVGSGLLDIQGNGSFSGPINIQQGVVLNQNSTGLGGGGGTTTVAPGAALALANGTAYNNGDIESGIQVPGEHLVVNSNASLQTVTITGLLYVPSNGTTATFSLALDVNGNTQTTGQLAATIPATVAASDTNPTDSLQNALVAAAAKLGFANATVSVRQTGDVYNVTFGGSLAGASVQLSVASISDPNTFVIIGGGTGNNTLGATQTQPGPGTWLTTPGAPVAPFGVWAATTSEWQPSVTLFQASTYLAGLTTTTVNGNTVGSNSIIPTDIQWLGPVTLGGSTPIDVPAGTRLIIGGAIDDATNTTGVSDLVKIGGGELTLQGVNSYRGNTYVGTSATATIPGFDPDGVNEFFNGGNAIAGGVLTAAGNQALGAAASPTVQQLTFTNAVNNQTQFQLVFVSAATGPATTTTLTYTGNAITDALNIQNALNALPNVGGRLVDALGNVTQAAVNPNGEVTVTPTSTAGQFLISFGGSLSGFNQQLKVQLVGSVGSTTNAALSLVTAGSGGVVVQNGSALQLEGNITIAGKTLELAGRGYNPAAVPLVVPDWAELGPAPVLNGPTINGKIAATAGRITGIAVDPTDPSGKTVYVSTAGGAFKTEDGGQSWVPIFDNYGATDLGSIAIAPSNPHIIYIGTGEANNAADNSAGIGVFESTDDGHTWTLLTSQTGTANPLAGLGITKIAVDQGSPSVIYVATSDQVANAGANAVPGIYRWDGKNWTNLTAIVSSNRATNKGSQTAPPNKPGPDDNYLLSFPQKGVTWSDVAVVGTDSTGQNNVLYAALGTAQGTSVTNFGTTTNANAVYFALDPTAAANKFAWYIGDGGTDAETSTTDAPQVANAGNIKISVFNSGNSNNPFFFKTITVQAVYADTSGNLAGQMVGTVGAGSLLGVFKLGMAYAKGGTLVTPPDGQEQYSLAIYTPDGSNVYIGTQSTLQWSAAGGAFSDITVDSNGKAPHISFHALGGAGSSVYGGTDGGIWQLNTASNPTNQWTDINGNLANDLTLAADSSPTNPGDILAATHSAGIDQYGGSLAWNLGTDQGSQGIGLGYTPNGTRVAFDPQNPNVAYGFVSDAIIPNGITVAIPDTTLMKSTNGGTSWSNTGVTYAFYGGYNAVLAVDAVNPQRVLTGGAFVTGPQLQESTDGAATFHNLNLPNVFFSVSQIALATYQGTFVGDPAFPLVTDQRANTDVPGTIYISDGNDIWLTRNYTQSWAKRDIPGVNKNINALVVDPSNSNVVYALIGGHPGISTGRVYKSVDGGQNWNAIGGVTLNNTNDGLPDVSANTLVVDPRTGTLYVGDDLGVYVLTAGAAKWVALGTGIPAVRVTDLSLNQASNTLFAATYGRSVMALPLSDVQANAGALVAISGQTQWTGPIVLSGATTISAQGSQLLQSNQSAAQLIVSGTISDLTASTANSLTVGTGAGAGTVTFSGPNVYAGTTEVADGVLIAANQTALGGTTNGTTVDSGAALELAANLDAEPVVLNGNGVAPGINGHNTGALEGIASNVTFQGPITLNTPNVTIGVVSGASLRLTGQISGSGSLIKELTGTLVLDQTQQDTYVNTFVNQGLLLVESSMALSAAGSVTVLDGAAIGLFTPTDPTDPNFGAAVTASGSLSLSGSGIHNTGALVNLGGANKWSGNVTLDANPGFAALTYPVGTITIGVGLNGNPADATDILTISGNITEGTSGLYAGLTKTGPDTLVLAGSDNYNGTTFINSGVVRIQNAQALGDSSNAPIQRLNVFDPNENSTFTLSLKLGGQTGTTGPISTTANAGTLATSVQTQLNSLLASLGANMSVSVTGVAMPVAGSTEVILSIVFQGAGLAGLNMPQLVAIASGSATVIQSEVADNTYGTEVAAGAALQLDLANAPSKTVNESVELNGSGPANAVAISAASETGTTASITTATANDFQNGELVTISGITPSDYNGTFPITVVDATHFTFTAPAGLGSATLSAAQAIPALGNGALENLSGVNTLTGTVNLQTSSVLGVYANPVFGSQLTVTGAVTGTWAASLTKTGGGILGLAAANQYQGTTNIVQGAISAQNHLALGGPLTSEVQTITLTGALTGNYTLTFTDNTGNSQTTGLIPANAGTPQATAAAMAAALEGLSNMPKNSVDVYPATSNGVYIVVFYGAWAGVNLGNPGPLTVATASSGLQVGVATNIQGGQGNTIVSPGATLQLYNNGSGDVHMSTEQVILDGATATSPGATLESVFGNNSWDPNTQPLGNTYALAADPNIAPIIPDSTIILNGNATIRVDFGSTLTVNQTVAQAQAPSNLIKSGPGVLLFSGALSNTYSGLTTVADGTLQLGKTGGSTVIDIPANLQVGDGVGGVGSALAQLEPPPAGQASATQLGSSATLTILSDGSFDLNGQAQTVGALNMTGGSVNLATSPASSFTLAGPLTAVEDAAGNPAIIEAGQFISSSGTFTLGGTSATTSFTINGPTTGKDKVDLDVQVPIIASQINNAQFVQIVKSGAGRLELDADSSQTLHNSISDTAGDVQVDGAVGQIDVNGGGVSGKGTVGVLDGTSNGTPVVGTINPGDNAAPLGPTGILNNNFGTTFETWGPNTTFAVDLTDTSGSTIAGSDYDQLDISGSTNLALGGAVLSGTANTNIKLKDAFTILLANSGSWITGQFADPAGVDTATNLPIAYIGGTKFDVQYKSNGVLDPVTNKFDEWSSVVLIRAPQTATMTLVSSGTLVSGTTYTSYYGQDVAFTAALTVDKGLGSAPAGSAVVFTLDGSTQVTIPVQNNKAVFDPAQNYPGYIGTPLSVASHTVSASFTANGISSPTGAATVTAGPVIQKVGTAPSATAVTVSQAGTTIPAAGSAVYSTTTPIDIQVTVTPKLTEVSNAATPAGPDTVSLTLNGKIYPAQPLGGPSGSGNLPNVYTFALSGLAVGSYTGSVRYNGSASTPQDYSSSTSSPISFIVTKDTSSVALSAVAAGTNSGTNSVSGQLVTFTAIVSTNAPGTATPVLTPSPDLVTFTDNGVALTSVKIAVDTSSGQPVYKAVVPISTLAVGTHSIVAVYKGSSDLKLGGSQSSPLTFTVAVDQTKTSLTATPALPNNWGLGQPVTFVANVTPVPPGTGIPAGTVSFYDDINSTTNPQLLTSVPVSSTGSAQFVTSSLTAGAHDIYAVYAGSTKFGGSTSNHIANSVLLGTATSLSSSKNPANVGDSVTFTAVVTSIGGTGTPAGTVSFYEVDPNNPNVIIAQLATGVTPNTSGDYITSTNALTFGAHALEAVFTPTGNVFAASTSTILTENVRSATAITLSSASPNPSSLGQPITLTASVTAVPSANPNPTSGTVTFFSGSASIGTATVGAGGIATLTTTGLAHGTDTLTASYAGSTLYQPSGPSNALTQTVLYASSSTLTTSLSPAGVASTITLVATVRPALGTPTGAGLPTGTVTFYDTISGSPVAITAGTGGVNVTINSSSQAKLVITGADLGVGVHPIYAAYSGNGNNFGPGSSNTVNEVIAASLVISSSGTFNAPNYDSVYGQPLDFSATVTPTPAGTAPQGTVTFTAGGIVLGKTSVNASGVAAIANITAASTLGTHTITATYTPAAGELLKINPGSMTEVVTADPTTTTLISSSSTSVFGQKVTFTATIGIAPGATAPQGTVTFVDTTTGTAVSLGTGSTSVAVKFNTTNQDYEATFATSALLPGSHTITANFIRSTTNFIDSSNSMTQTVGQATTTTAVTSSINPASLSSAGNTVTVTFTATVSPTGSNPTGSVQFTIDGSTATGTVTAKGGGVWTLTEVTQVAGNPGSPGLAFGAHTVTAAFTSSDTTKFSNSDSTANPLTEYVLNRTQTVVSTASPSSALFGTSLTFTATVTSAAAAGNPTDGSVTFLDNGAAIAGSTTNLNGSNVVTFSTSGLAVGTHKITAEYNGDSTTYAVSVSTNSLSETIFAVASSMKVSVTSPTSGVVFPGLPFTLTALIYDSSGHLITTQPAGSQATLILYKGTTPGGTVVTTATATFTNGKFTFGGLVVSQGTYVAHITYGSVTVDFLINANGRIS